jgi:hypothetical protein
VRFDQAKSFGVAVLAALAIHVVAIVGLVLSISFQPPVPEVAEPRIMAVSAAPPPPPDVETLGPVDVPVMVPRFRPREPLGVTPQDRQRFGNPALAVWKYLCNRDMALSEAAQVACPENDVGLADTGLRDPLNRQGDAGIMFGTDTSTMSLHEAGVKRGWIKKPPASGQSGLAAKTDQTIPQVEMPWDEGVGKGARRSSDAGETVPGTN